MKRLFLILSFLTAAAFELSAQEFLFGAKAGVCASWLPGYPVLEYTRPLPHNAFYGGVSAEYVFANDMFVEADVLYCGKGHSANDLALGKFSHNLNYLQVPVYFGMKFVDGRYSVMIGPELGISLGGNVKPDGFSVLPYNLNPTQFFVAVQTTYMINDFFGVDVKFDFGATDTFRDGGKNLSIQLGLCCKFGN